MGYPPRSTFNSYRRLLRKLRPDIAPVVGPQIPAGHAAIGEALDADALFRRHAAHLPVANSRARNAQPVGQCIAPINEVGSLIQRMRRLRARAERHSNVGHGAEINTLRVYFKHHVITHFVFNRPQ